MAVIKSFRDLIGYQKSFELACKIYEITRSFPEEEQFSLTDQIRRSSMSVCVNIAKAWAMKFDSSAFVDMLSDALAKQMETEILLKICVNNEFVDNTTYTTLLEGYDEVRRILTSMINKPERFCRDH